MKKQNSSIKRKQVKPAVIKKSDTVTEGYDSDNERGTFSAWLRTGEGVELMKMFVITNSLIVFLTMTWPHIKEMLGVLYSFFYDDIYF